MIKILYFIYQKCVFPDQDGPTCFHYVRAHKGNTSRTGPVWAWYLVPTCVLYGLALMSLVFGPHVGPLWACPYRLVRSGPIWVLYGRAHMGKYIHIPHWSHMGLLSVECIIPDMECVFSRSRVSVYRTGMYVFR